MTKQQRRRARRAASVAAAAAAGPPAPARRFLGRHHDGLVRAAVQNGWILAGVFLLGWSASLVIGGIYLETLFGSLGLAHAVRRARRQGIGADQGSVGEVTKTAVMVGLAQGVFLLVFLFGLLRAPADVEPIWTVWPFDLGLMFSGALLAGAADYVIVQRRVRGAPDAWVRGRAERQQMSALALVLLMMVVPWSFLVIGERGMVATLFVMKGLLDVWLVGPSEGA